MFNRHLLKAGKLSFLALMISLSVSATSFAANFVWDGTNANCGGEWTDSDCWDDEADTPLNATPGSGDSVFFQADSGACSIPSSSTITITGLSGNLTTSYYNSTLTVDSSTLTVTGNLSWDGGTMSVENGSTLDVNGTVTVNGGTISLSGTSTVDVEGATTIQSGSFVSNSNTGAWDFNSSLAVSGGTFTASTGDLWVHTTYTQSGGTVNIGSGNHRLGTTTSNTISFSAGTLNMGNGTLQFSGNATISGTAEFNGSASGTWNVDGTFSVTSSVAVDAPYLTKIGGTTFTLGASASWNEGTYTVEFDSTGNTTIDIQNTPTPSTESFYNIKVNMTGSSSALTLSTTDVLSGINYLELVDGSISNSSTGKIQVPGYYTVASTFSGGTLNVELTGANTSTITPGGTSPKLTINNASAVVKPVGSTSTTTITFGSYVTILAGLLTLDTDTIDQGILNVYFNNTITVNGGTLDLVKTEVDSELHVYNTSNGFTLTTGTVNGGADDYTSTSPFRINGGTLTTNDTDISCSVFTLDGTLNAGASTISVGNDFDILGGTFNEGTSTIILTGTSSPNFDVNNSEIFYNLTFNQTGTSTIYGYVFTEITVQNAFVLSGGKFRFNGVVNIPKPELFDYQSTFGGRESGTGYFNFIASSNDQTIEIGDMGDAGYQGTILLPGIKLTENGKSNFGFRYTGPDDPSYSQLLISGSLSSGAPTIYASTLNANVTLSSGLNISHGTVYLGEGNLLVQQTYTQSGGNIYIDSTSTASIGNVSFSGGTTYVSANSFSTSSNFNLAGGTLDLSAMSLGSSASFGSSTSADFTISGGTFLGGANSLSTSGDLVIYAGSFSPGTGDYTIGVDLLVNYYSGGANNVSVNFGNNNVTVPGTFRIGRAGSASAEFIAPGAGKSLQINGTVSQEGGTSFTHNSGKVVFGGSNSISVSAQSFDFNFYDLDINKAVSNYARLGRNATVSNDIHLISGIFETQNYTLTLGGDWTKEDTNATYTPGSGTVLLTEGNHNINGDTTFNNLTKTGSSELVFEAGSTTTITGTWTCQGTSTSDPLYLKSSIPGTLWNIDPQGSRVLANLVVQDSNNINTTDIDARGTGSIEPETNPNNFNWIFDAPPGSTVVVQLSPTTQTGDTTPLFRWEDLTGETSYTIQVRNLSDGDWSSPVLEITDIPADTTSISAPTALNFGSYTWRIYSDISDPIEATTRNFTIINLVPEFNTYLYTLMFLAGAYFIFRMRQKEEM